MHHDREGEEIKTWDTYIIKQASLPVLGGKRTVKTNWLLEYNIVWLTASGKDGLMNQS